MLLFCMDGAALYRDLRWARDPVHAVACTVRDIYRMPRVYAGVHALPLYQHCSWPCTSVVIVGLVVAATTLETRCIYTIDDGTACIDVACDHETEEREELGVDPCYIPWRPVRQLQLSVGMFARAAGRICGSERYIGGARVTPVGVNDEAVHACRALALADAVYACRPVQLCEKQAAAQQQQPPMHPTPPRPHLPPPARDTHTVGSFVALLRKHLDATAPTHVSLDALVADDALSRYAQRVVASKQASGATRGKNTSRMVRRVFFQALESLVRRGYLAAGTYTHEYTIQPT